MERAKINIVILFKEFLCQINSNKNEKIMETQIHPEVSYNTMVAVVAT